jgi:hypothetical protein
MFNIIADSLLVATLQYPLPNRPDSAAGKDAKHLDNQADLRRRRGWLSFVGVHL